MKKIILGVTLVLALATGCFLDDDDDRRSGPGPIMADIWPHADGSTWSYELDYSGRRDPATRPATVLPSMEDLRDQLMEPLTSPDFGGLFLYDLSLDGLVTTQSGVTAQRVVEEVVAQDGTSAKTGAMIAEPAPRRLLRAIALFRPDLREAIAEELGAEKADFDTVPDAPAPYFIGGYAFAYEDSGYYSYGDLDRDHSWVYLEGELRAGHEFSLQLVPRLADDIWLHGRIWSVRNRSIDGRRYADVVECMYVVDMGLQTLTDEQGAPRGEYRPYLSAVTWFVPGIGPVAGRERIHGLEQTAYNPTDVVFTATWECRLEDFVLPAEE